MLSENDDMDELFRRASDSYPLNTASNNWDKVREGLVTKELETEGAKKARNYNSLLLLLLLVPFVWICNKNPNISSGIISEKRTNEQPFKSDKSIATSKTIEQEEAKSKVNLNENFSATSKPDIDVKKQNSSHKLSGASVKSVIIDKRNRNNNEGSQTLFQNDLLPNNNGNNKLKAHETMLGNNNEPLEKGTNKLEETKQLVIENKPLTKDTANIAKESIATVKQQDKPKKLYAGLIGFGEVTTISFQKVQHPAVGLGVLVGYKLSKKISIETGAYAEKKYYYTVGKYFKPKNPYTQPNTTLLNAEGNCKMVDVPLNVKYNFKTSSSYNLSAVTGLSSYFMSKENYDYEFNQMGSIRDRYIMYTSKSINWAAVVNAGVSYERKISKKAILRIEPNIKLPLRGIGYGRIKMITAGLNVGITKDLF